MKTLLNTACAAAITTVLIAATPMPAQAGYGLDGYFGGRCSPDAAINLRRTTTEQYQPARAQSVSERPRLDYAPTSLATGPFQMFASLFTGAAYDSNIYASDTATQSDVIGKVNPLIAAVTNWGRHALAITGLGDFNFYSDNTDQNTYGGAVQAEGRYDIAAKTYVAANAGYQRLAEPRSSPNSTAALDEPVAFDIMTAGLEAYRGAGLLSAKLALGTRVYEYTNTDLVAGGKSLQSQRDRVQNTVGGELAYEISQNLKPFVRANYEWRDYTQNAQRSSDGYNIVAGARMDIGGILSGSAYAGYLTRDYRNFASGTVDALDVGAELLWNITELTSLAGEFGRSIEETTVGGFVAPAAASSFTATGGSLTLSHELRRNLVLEARGHYTQNDFNLNPRTDDVWGAGAGVRYYFNRHLFADATYDFSQRDSNAAGADYDKNVIFLRLGAQY